MKMEALFQTLKGQIQIVLWSLRVKQAFISNPKRANSNATWVVE